MVEGANIPLTEGAENLIATLKTLGYKTAILSGGFTFMGQHLQQRLGIDYVFANELETQGGKVTGNVVGRIVDGARKAELLREIAQKEGIFVGITAGATFAGALEVCKGAAAGSTVLCMLPDTGERYLSTPLFADIGVDMNEDELKISNSTPNHRMAPKAA